MGKSRTKKHNTPAQPQKESAAETKRKLPGWAGWLIGYPCVLVGAAGLAYFWRVAYMLGADLPALPFTLGVMGLFTLLYAVLFLLVRYVKDLSLRGAVLVFVLGLLFVFANAPLQAPDEVDHFKRAYAVSMGRFSYDGAGTYPRDVDLLVDAFPGGYNFKVMYAGQEMVPSAFAKYHAGLAGDAEVTAQTESTPWMILPFLPQALFMAASRLFGFTALGAMYAGRMANLLVYALVCWAVFRNCDKYRGVFFALAALPLSLFMAASCSVDGPMLALCFLLISFFCKKEIYNRDVVVFALALACVTYIKPNNLVLAAVLLLIPKARWKSRINPWLALGGMLAAALILRQIGDWLDGGVLLHNIELFTLSRGANAESTASVGGQLSAILRNPLHFLVVLVLTTVENAGFLVGGSLDGSLPGLGTFGSLDLTIPLVAALSLLSMAAASALGIQQREDTKNTGALALFLMGGFYYVAVMAGLYVTHTDIDSIRVTGLQPRYFLPAFLLLFMLASILLGKAVRPRLSLTGGSGTLRRTESITLWLVAGVAAVSVLLLFGANFIGQWLPKAEGGWKLVNMFRWVQR